MVTFLTSSPTKELSPDCPFPALDERNGFLLHLSKSWLRQARCLMIAATPDAHALNDEMTAFYREALENCGFSLSCFDLWDDRLPPLSKEEVQRYDAIFLAGGHVPTEHRWFEAIGLREKLIGYGGLVIGTSAGSMNAARTVYAWPEEEGESFLPLEDLFFPGLALSDTIVLPHYQKLKDSWLDGRRLMEDITCAHSHGQKFLLIPDGSYVLVKDGAETVFGEAYLASDGQIIPFCRENECRRCP